MFVRAHIGKFLDQNPELEPHRERILAQLAVVDSGGPMDTGALEAIFRNIPSVGVESLTGRFLGAITTLPYLEISLQYMEKGA